MKEYKVTIFTRSYKQIEYIFASDEDILSDMIYTTNLYYINGERPLGYLYEIIK